MRQWLGLSVEHHAEVGSTNDVAAARAREGAPHGTCVSADAQSAGRGRLGRRWHSPPGRALYLSVVLRPSLNPAEVPPITLAAGVAVCRALNGFGAAASIKWPNDLLAGNPPRKLAGILTEMSTQANQVAHVILGIGVNLTHEAEDFPADLAATSLALVSAAPVERQAFLEYLLDELERTLDLFFKKGPSAIAPDWRESAATIGQTVTVATDRGSITGLAESLDDSGALVVLTPDGKRHRVVAGELT